MPPTKTPRKPRADKRIAPGKVSKVSKTKAGVFERTVLLPIERADAFHAVIRGLPAFTEASVQRDHKAKGERRFYVRWQRTEAKLLTASEQEMQDARVQRGVEQFFDMEFLPMANSETMYYCIHFKGPEEEAALYQVSLTECDCPDTNFRLLGSSLFCKHRAALRIFLNVPEEKQERKRYTPAEKAENIARDF